MAHTKAHIRVLEVLQYHAQDATAQPTVWTSVKLTLKPVVATIKASIITAIIMPAGPQLPELLRTPPPHVM